MDPKHLDIVSIGDTVVDAFIKIKLGNVESHNGETEFCLPFGSKVPYDSVKVIPAVGNCANAAVSAARLGLHTGLVSYLGDDANGKDCLARLEEEHVATDFISSQVGKITNYHYVLWHGDERTILVKHEAFDAHLPDIGEPKWIYLTSLGSHTKELHEEIMNYLDAHPNVKLAFQPGTFQISMGTEVLKRLYAHTEVFCANLEEDLVIEKTENHDIKSLLDGIEKLGPKIILLSDGPHGAYMKAHGTYYQVPLYPDIAAPYERTGAGDAFCSTFVSALALGKTPQEALLWGPINSMSVVQYVGAQEGLLTREKLEDYLKNAPSDYKVNTL